MKNVKAKLAAGVTVIALGGLAGLALSQGGTAPTKKVAAKPIVHTKVIRRTVHVTKHAKPKHPPAAAPVEPAAAGPSGASAPVVTGSSGGATEAAPVATGASSAGSTESAPVSTGSSGTGSSESAPVSTGASGAGGGGGGEVEHEGGGGGDD